MYKYTISNYQRFKILLSIFDIVLININNRNNDKSYKDLMFSF